MECGELGRGWEELLIRVSEFRGWVTHASRVLVLASRQNALSLSSRTPVAVECEGVRESDTLSPTREMRAATKTWPT